MKIAFAHYHLKTGGVTTVLRQQIEAIKKRYSPFPADIKHIPGLAYYGRSSQKTFNPKKMAS